MVAASGAALVAAWMWNAGLFPLNFPAKQTPRMNFASFRTEAMAQRSLAYQYFIRGVLTENLGNYSKAAALFGEAKAHDPQAALPRIHLGVNLARAGFREDAEREFESAKALRSNDPTIRVLTALMFAAQNQLPEAIRQFELIIRDNPEDLFALSSLADLYILAGRLEDALSILDRISDLRPHQAVVYFHIAIIETRLRRFESAQAHLLEATALEPSSLRGWVALGLVYEAQKKYPEAVDAFEQAIELDPVRTELYHNLAKLYFAWGKPVEALAQYDAVLKLQPKDIHAALDAAYLLLLEERNADAIARVDIAITAGASHPKLFFMKGLALMQMSQRKEARRSFREALAQEPLYGDAHFYLGVLLSEEGDSETAEYHLRRAVELDPWNAQAHNYLGYLLAETGKYLDEAIALIQKAISLEPSNPAYLDSLGWAYYKKGLYDRAVAELERALEHNSDDWVIRNHLIDAYQQAGEKEKAAQLKESATPQIRN